MNREEILGLSTGKAVRVQRSGNSKVLPVPAEISRGAHVELGEDYVLEVVGDDLLYRRSAPGVHISGHGAGRVGLVPAAQILAAPQRTAVPPLTWDF